MTYGCKLVLDDTTIMEGTRILPAEKGKGLITVEYTLSTGLKIDSGAMAGDSLKGKVLLDWCDHVRNVSDNEIARKEQEDEAKRKKRKRGDLPEKLKADDIPLKPTADQQEPMDYVRSSLKWAEEKVERLTEEKLRVDAELSRAQLKCELWKRINDTLGEKDDR